MNTTDCYTMIHHHTYNMTLLQLLHLPAERAAARILKPSLPLAKLAMANIFVSRLLHTLGMVIFTPGLRRFLTASSCARRSCARTMSTMAGMYSTNRQAEGSRGLRSSNKAEKILETLDWYNDLRANRPNEDVIVCRDGGEGREGITVGEVGEVNIEDRVAITNSKAKSFCLD